MIIDIKDLYINIPMEESIAITKKLMQNNTVADLWTGIACSAAHIYLSPKISFM
jgi:hypothetical protein